MAQKPKETVDYFPFYVKDGRTLFALQRKYGLAGIGFFTQIMRMLGTTPGHYYVYIEDYDKDRLNTFCGMGETDVRAMITDMVNTGKIDRELWEDRNVIYCQDFVDNLSNLYNRRTAEDPSKERVLSETAAICQQHVSNMSTSCKQHVDIPQRTVQHIREDKIRVEKSREEESIEEMAPSADAPASVEQQALTIPDQDQHLYHTIKTTFEKEQPGSRFTNYAKEGKAIKQLIAKARARSPDDPEPLAMGMIEAFRKIREIDEFFRKQPFLPSSLNSAGIYDRVLTWAMNEQEKAAEWEDEIERASGYEEVVF